MRIITLEEDLLEAYKIKAELEVLKEIRKRYITKTIKDMRDLWQKQS
jgi:hypothetical protein